MVKEKVLRLSDRAYYKARTNPLRFVEIRLNIGVMSIHSFWVQRTAPSTGDGEWIGAAG